MNEHPEIGLRVIEYVSQCLDRLRWASVRGADMQVLIPVALVIPCKKHLYAFTGTRFHDSLDGLKLQGIPVTFNSPDENIYVFMNNCCCPHDYKEPYYFKKSISEL